MIYLLAGVVVGFAVGIAYISTLSNLIKWFPANKGLISGISVGAFGSGSLLFKYVNAALIADVGVSGAFFYYWGAIVMGLIVVGSLLLKEPVLATNAAQQGANGLGNDFSVRQMLATKEAYLLFTIFFAACMSGLYLIGIVKDMGVQLAGMDLATAANTVSAVAIFNTAGRIILGTLSDKVGRMRVISFTMLVTVLAIVALSFMTLNHTLFFICVGAVAFCFGGNITVFPAIVGDFFGLKNHSKTTASSTGASARARWFVRRQILRRLPRHLHGDWRSVRRFSADYAVHQSAEGSGSGNGRNHPNGGAGQSLIPRETTRGATCGLRPFMPHF